MSRVVTRFAPSPSGAPHAGNIRTALFSWLWAKHHGGTFCVRIEDTNQEKSTPESIKVIFDTLEWLGIKSDVEVIYQSKRMEIYKKYVERLLELGLAYKCYCTQEHLETVREAQKAAGQKPLYDRTCYGAADQPGKPYVVRFKVPSFGGVQWKDLNVGRVQVRHAELSDFILQRADGSVTFLLANMLDDALQGVTHVLRGSDGISHCHGQILLYEALGFPVPEFGHLPFVLNSEGDKLSKRNGDDSILDLRDKGYLPEAVINALARIGWSHGNQEIFSVSELIELFDIKSVGKSAGVFDPQKLLHINSHWIKNGDPVRLATLVAPFLRDLGIVSPKDLLQHDYLIEAVKTLQTRAKTLHEMAAMAEFYYRRPLPSAWGGQLSVTDKTQLAITVHYLKKHEPTLEGIEAAIKAACEECGCKVKELGPSIRLALTGSLSAPGLYEMIHVLGITETVERLETAIALP